MICTVVDSSVWAAAILTRNSKSASRLIFKASIAGRIRVVVSVALIDELVSVFRREGVSDYPIAELVEFLRSGATLFDTHARYFGCRDHHDDIVLETAINGRAKYLVSLDQDLHDEEFRSMADSLGVTILNAGQFLEILRQAEIVIGDDVQPAVSYLRLGWLPAMSPVAA